MTRQLQLVIDAENLNAVAPDYHRIEVRPTGGALGAEIHGVDLAQPLDDACFAEIHRAFLDHQVIFFRDQDITPGQMEAFGRRFGEFHIHPYLTDCLAGHPAVMVVRKAPADRINVGGTWHSDATFEPRPPLGTMLLAKRVPEHGGDTLFANLYLAYDLLSAGMKRLLDGVRAIHSADLVFGEQGDYASDVYRSLRQGTEARTDASAARTVAHPVVRTHPETGRKALWVNRSFTIGLEDMSVRESEPLLEFLFSHAATPDFTARFQWREGSLAFWDNRCVHHYALNDYPGRERVMHRLTIAGDRPR